MNKIQVPVGAAALAKGLNLMNMVADTHKPLRFSELHRQSALPKPTFSRILKTLLAFGLVRHDEQNGTYLLGSRLMELSHKVWETFDLSAIATFELKKLSKQLGETVALCKLDGDQVRYLDECSGDGLGVRIDPGRHAPLHATAAGKALLAFQEPAIVRGLTSRLAFTAFTENTKISLEQLQSELILTRARGYAISFEEHLPGVNAVAVVIVGKNNSPLGALTVLGPASRMNETSIHPIGRELIAAARRITGSAGAVAINSRPRPRLTEKLNTEKLQCVLPWGAQLGEAPVWHEKERLLYWVDILKPCVCRYNPKTGRNETQNISKLVSAVLLAENNRLLLATQDGIEWFEFSTGKLTPFVHPEKGRSENRLNDAKVGPEGSIWVGSMSIDASQPSGGLYHISKGGHFELKETGLYVSNGLDWSPDKKTLYFVDTVPGIIYAYDVAVDSKTLANRRVFATISKEEGRPDGLVVDMNGGVWVAIWDGWRVNRYLPNGTFDRFIDIPVPRPTSVAFGGTDLKTLYITSARTRLPADTLAEAPLSGGLFECIPGETGIAGRYFKASNL